MCEMRNQSVLVFRVWPSWPLCRAWRTTTASRRRCPSRPWSTRPTGALAEQNLRPIITLHFHESSSGSRDVFCPETATLIKPFSLRCFFIAQSYVLVKKWSEALVLYERVLKYAKEVQSKAKSLNNRLKVGSRSKTRHTNLKPLRPLRSHAASHPPHSQDLPDVQELIAEVNAEKYSLQAAAILGEAAARSRCEVAVCC